MSKSLEFNRAWVRFLVLAMTSIVALAALPTVAQTTIAQKLAVPAYFTPESGYWTQLDQGAPTVTIAIANIINGPNYLAATDYENAIQAAHAAGITVLGYVDTGFFGTTGLPTRLGPTDTVSWQSQIESDVNAWFNFYGSYGLDGIFFDEGLNTCGTNTSNVTLYTDIENYVKQNHLGALVATNPGSPVPQCYQNAADILVTFEGLYDCYNQDSLCAQTAWYQGLSWNPVDPNKIWHLVYNTSQTELATASALTKQRNAGYVYITPDTGTDPWDTLPATGTGGYWSGELADAAPGGSDHTIPTPPNTLDTVNVGSTWAILNWGPSTDYHGSGVVGYDVYESGVKIVSVPASANPQVTINGLQPSTNYSFTAKARTAAGNMSAPSNNLQFTTDIRDGTDTAPGNLHTTQVTYTSATLAWNASRSNDYPIAYYDVYQNGTKVLTVDAIVTSVTVVGLTPGQTPPTYSFYVQGRDTDGDISPASSTINVTPTALPTTGALANESGTYTSTTLTYTATYYLPFALRHVFIDSDDNAGTGYQIPWTSPAMGLDYMIENSTLYKYAGVGSDWTWTSVGTVTPTVNGYNVTWQLPVSDLTNAATTQLVLFEGDGFEPTAYPYPYPNPPVVPVTLTKQP